MALVGEMQYLTIGDNTYSLPSSGGSGTVTSIGVSNATDGGLTISGSPVTSSGSITIGHDNVLTSAQTTSGIYPIKIDKNGHISEYGSAVTIPSITLNGSSTTSPSFYAPTSAGTDGYVLKSNGSGAPTWTSATLTDTLVTQTNATPSSYTYWRPLVIGSSSNSTEGFTPSTTTSSTYTFNTLEVQPSSGTIRLGGISMYNGSYTAKFTPATLTANRTITVPNATGTIALTSDIHNVPSGGTQGQVLTKSSGTDYDASWADPSGGSFYVAFTYNSGTDTWSADKTSQEIHEAYVDGLSVVGYTPYGDEYEELAYLYPLCYSEKEEISAGVYSYTAFFYLGTIMQQPYGGNIDGTYFNVIDDVVTQNEYFLTLTNVTDTYSGTSSLGMSGKAVKSAIDALDGTVSGTAGAGKTLTALSQTDGKVSATFGDISITKSQISDFPTIPTVNNATLTIQKNGTTIDTFTANAAVGKTVNIEVHDVPSGGTSGQVLAKNSGTDYDVTWINAGGGGTSTPTSDTIAKFDSSAKMNSTNMTSAEVTTFVESLDISGGGGSVPTFNTATITLATAGWSNNSQTVTVQGVTASNIVIVNPAPASYDEYVIDNVRCTGQDTNELTFSCDFVPDEAITVSVIITSVTAAYGGEVS